MGAAVSPVQYDPAGHVVPVVVDEPAGQYEPAAHVHALWAEAPAAA